MLIQELVGKVVRLNGKDLYVVHVYPISEYVRCLHNGNSIDVSLSELAMSGKIAETPPAVGTVRNCEVVTAHINEVEYAVKSIYSNERMRTVRRTTLTPLAYLRVGKTYLIDRVKYTVQANGDGDVSLYANVLQGMRVWAASIPMLHTKEDLAQFGITNFEEVR